MTSRLSMTCVVVSEFRFSSASRTFASEQHSIARLTDLACNCWLRCRRSTRQTRTTLYGHLPE